MDANLDLTLKVVVAAVVGGIIGLERELRGHDPGIRTHALVAVGAAMFTIAGAYGFEDVRDGETADPTRIAAQVAAGVGFIGAGAVLRSGRTVRGLTTAATLWVSAAVGVAAGAGIYVPLVAAMVVTLVVLVGLRLAKPRLLVRLGGVHCQVRIEYERGHGTLGPLIRQLEDLQCRVAQLHVDDDGERVDVPGLRRVTIRVQTRDEDGLTAAVGAFEHRAEIVSVSIEPVAT